MLQWVWEAVRELLSGMPDIIKFSCLTGLRPFEAIQAFDLIINP
jgi:hypothetical protein